MPSPASASRWVLAIALSSLLVWILGIRLLASSGSGDDEGDGGSGVIEQVQGLLQSSELQQVEEIPSLPPVIPNRMIRRRKGQSKKHIAEELAAENAARRLFYFPDPRAGAVDPTAASSEAERHYFYPGREWRDSEGRPIQAHGGGILYVAETNMFYWYGENKDGPTYHVTRRSSARVDLIGISCYSSRDLWLWTNEGIVLRPDKLNKTNSLHITNVLERPKVLYNSRTKQYVMWMHVDSANYSKASVGVATSSRPQGPFTYHGSMRPHGFDSRDMTVFKDEDDPNETAYLVYSSVSNSELHISPLTDDYLGLRKVLSRVMVSEHREAPAVFKHRGTYYMITSGCTGWLPNPAMVHAADAMLGPWYNLGDPCVGGNEEFRSTTFYSQVSFVLPLPGLADLFVVVADRWNAKDLRDSRYVWLPLTIDGPLDGPVEENGFEFPVWSKLSIRWHRKWKLPSGWNGTRVYSR